MSNNWSKEDKAVWDNSEVMQELESRVLKNITRVELMAKKIAALSETGANAVANSKMPVYEKKQLLSAEDAEYNDDDVIDDQTLEDDLDDGLLDGEVWDKEAMLLKLREVVKKASDKGNYALAYKIERTIDEILEG